MSMLSESTATYGSGPSRSPTRSRNPFSANPLTLSSVSASGGGPYRSPSRSGRSPVSAHLNMSGGDNQTFGAFQSRSGEPSAIHSTTADVNALSVHTAETTRQLRDDQSAKDRLVQDAQRQVRELLKFKEEANLAKTEVKILQEKLVVKEDDLGRKERLALNEREERDHSVQILQGRLTDLQTSSSTAIHRQEERLRDSLGQTIALKREIEGRDAKISQLDTEVNSFKRQLNTEQDRVRELQQSLSSHRDQIRSLEAKVDEGVRDQMKAESTNAAFISQLNDKDLEIRRLTEDYDHVKKKKSELLVQNTESEAQRSALLTKMADLTHELEVIPKLKAEIAGLMASREELATMRQVMEESEIAMASERSYRRTLEMDKEQLQLKIQSLHEDLSNSERELHQAQVDAAEKVSLRRELAERAAALEVSQNTCQQLQHQVTEVKEQLHREGREKDVLEHVLQARVSVLRRMAEAALHDLDHGEESFSLSSGRFASYEKDGKADLFATSVLAPVETALRELASTFNDTRKVVSSLQKSLNGERSNIVELEAELREVNQTLTHQQLRNEKLQGSVRDLEGKNSRQATELGELSTVATENLTMLGITLGVANPNWEMVQSFASKTAQSAKQYRAQSERLSVALEDCEEKLEKETKDHEAEVEALTKEYETKIKDLNMHHALQMNEAAETQRSLSDSLAAAIRRHDATAKELQAVEKSYGDAILSLKDTQQKFTVAKQQADECKHQVITLEGEIKHQLTQRAQVENDFAQEKNAHLTTKAAVEDLKNEAADLTQRVAGYNDVVRVCVRAIIGLREASAGILEQRNLLITYSRHQDNAMAILTAESPINFRKPRPTLRVAAISVLVANRLIRMMRVSRGRRSVGFVDPMAPVKIGGGKGGCDRIVFPVLRKGPEKHFVFPEKMDNPSLALQQILVQFEEEGLSSPRRRGDSTLFQVASSTVRGRLAPQGPTAVARAVAGAYNAHIQSIAREAAARDENVLALRREGSDLKNRVAEAEDTNRRYRTRVEQLTDERDSMIDRRTHESVSQDLHHTKSELDRAVAERRALEGRYGELQNRELDLLSKHTTLQTEARTMALELARTSSGISGGSRPPMDTKGAWSSVQEVQSTSSTPRSGDIAPRSFPPSETAAPPVRYVPPVSSTSYTSYQPPIAAHRTSSPLSTSPLSGRGVSAPPLATNISTASSVGSANSTGDLLQMIRHIDSKISGALAVGSPTGR